MEKTISDYDDRIFVYCCTRSFPYMGVVYENNHIETTYVYRCSNAKGEWSLESELSDYVDDVKGNLDGFMVPEVLPVLYYTIMGANVGVDYHAQSCFEELAMYGSSTFDIDTFIKIEADDSIDLNY